MNYAGLPTKVSVVFYTKPEFKADIKSANYKQVRRAGFWIGLLGRTKIHHTGLMLSRDDKTVVLATGEGSRAKFIDEECYHTKGSDNAAKPILVADLGITDVSLKLLNQFIKVPYRGRRRDLFFYCLFSRFFFPSVLAKSCALLTCEMLRMIGYNIEDYVIPRDLERVLSKSYPIIPWEEYVKENKLRS